LDADELLSALEQSRIRYWRDPERNKRGRHDLQRARREVVADAFRVLDIEATSLVDAIAVAYGLEREKEIWLLEGAIDALESFRQQGLRLGLITNGEATSQRVKIERFGLAAFFETIIIEGEYGVGKPDERVYLHALKELEVEPHETWMAGDNLEWDVLAPQRLGIMGIWVNTRGEDLLGDGSEQPDRIVSSLAELVGQDRGIE
jgi:putative hydrolase of the HAD superfamily